MGGFSTLLGKAQASVVQVDYNYVLITGGQYGAPVGIVKRIYYQPYVEIISALDDLGVVANPVAVLELRYKIWYVRDLRHSHVVDSHDITLFSNITSGTEREVLVIDYGTVINAKYVFIIVSAYNMSSGYTGYVNVYTSMDGSTYTQIGSIPVTVTSETIFPVLLPASPFRYLRFTLVNGGANIYARIRKVIILYE